MGIQRFDHCRHEQGITREMSGYGNGQKPAKETRGYKQKVYGATYPECFTPLFPFFNTKIN